MLSKGLLEPQTQSAVPAKTQGSAALGSAESRALSNRIVLSAQG